MWPKDIYIRLKPGTFQHLFNDYPELKICKNKTKAKSRLKEVRISHQKDNEKFDYEQELQKFLGDHWNSTPMGEEWKLHGANFPIGEIGIIDLLARHKDKNEWLVIELKKDQSSDETVGQILRYMGWVKEQLLNGEGSVNGMIVSHTADDRIKYALSIVPNICLNIYSFEDGQFYLEDSSHYYLKEMISNLTKDEKTELLNEINMNGKKEN